MGDGACSKFQQICFWSLPPRGVIALEKLPHSWEANVEDFLDYAVYGGWGRLGQGGCGVWLGSGGGVTVLGV